MLPLTLVLKAFLFLPVEFRKYQDEMKNYKIKHKMNKITCIYKDCCISVYIVFYFIYDTGYSNIIMLSTMG